MASRVEKRLGKHYILDRTLGEGAFGKVKLAVDERTGMQVAIKIMEKSKIAKHKMESQVKKEMTIMKHIRHRHIVNLKEILFSKSKVFLVMELCSGGELFDKLVSERRFTEDLARKYFQQLISALEYCHSQNVCHRDLKPENLLLDGDGNLKITDFGLGVMYEEAKATAQFTTCGTPNYVAPEVLSMLGYDPRAADVWSCGVILYIFISGKMPFEDTNQTNLFRKIQRAEYEPFPDYFSPEVKTFISQILVADPNKRLSIPQIKQDEWFRMNYVEDLNAGEDLPGPSEEFIEVDGVQKINRTMNAFELINMCGGLDPLNIFNRGKTITAVKRHTRFSSRTPVAQLFLRIIEIFKSEGILVKQQTETKVRGLKITTNGEVEFVVRMFLVAGGVNMVEFTRSKGHGLEYNKIFHDVYKAMGPSLIENFEEPSISH